MQRSWSGLSAFAVVLTFGGALCCAGWEQSTRRGQEQAALEKLIQFPADPPTDRQRFLEPANLHANLSTIVEAAAAGAVQLNSVSVSRRSDLDTSSAEFVIEVDASGGYVSVKTWLAEVLARTDQVAVRRMSISRGVESIDKTHVTFSLVGPA